MAKYTVNFEVEGEVKDIEKFIENNVVSCPYIQIKNVEKKEISEIMEESLYIYERNPDTGEIFRRKKGDYTNKECVNPAVNSVPNL
jgi:hypothetical protein